MAQAQGGLKSFYTALVIVAVVGLGIIAWVALKPSHMVSIPADVSVLAGDTAGFRGYVMGSPDAPLEIVEYADYQCPACQSFETLSFPTVRQQLIETGRVRWRYRDFPLDQIHSHARVAAHAAACASDQDKYWEMHRAIYEGQVDWVESDNPNRYFRRYAQTLGLDLSQYDQCMESAKFAGRIQASHDEAIKLKVGQTPTFLIAGRLYPGALNSDTFKHLVDSLAPVPGR